MAHYAGFGDTSTWGWGNPVAYSRLGDAVQKANEAMQAMQALAVALREAARNALAKFREAARLTPVATPIVGDVIAYGGCHIPHGPRTLRPGFNHNVHR
jgi:hypothetical protein